MNPSRYNVAAILQRFLGGLKFRQLFLITVVVFIADLLVPDFIPFADEVLLGLLSVLFASLKKPGSDNIDHSPSKERNDL